MDPSPGTPSKSGQGLEDVIEHLNYTFDLQIPNPRLQSPKSFGNISDLRHRCYLLLRAVFFKAHNEIPRILHDYEEDIRASTFQWVVAKPRQEQGTIPSRSDFLKTDRSATVTEEERTRRLRKLFDLLEDEFYLHNGGSNSRRRPEFPLRQPRDLSRGSLRATQSFNEGILRCNEPDGETDFVGDRDEFYTAPSSPASSFDEREYLPSAEPFRDRPAANEEASNNSRGGARSFRGQPTRQSTLHDYMRVSKSVSQTAPERQILPPSKSAAASFASTVVSDVFDPPVSSNENTSFTTNITASIDNVDTMSQGSSNVNMMDYEEMFSDTFKTAEEEQLNRELRRRVQQEMEDKMIADLVADLAENGPFAKRDTWPKTVSLRSRYELERLREEWDLTPSDVLRGDKEPYSNHEDFWRWAASHTRRCGKGLPEKSSARAWNAAIDQFRVPGKHSEVVVFSGALEWRPGSKKGVFDLKLNPLRIDRSCRFHRRFGADRFLSLTMPAPARPPPHLRFEKYPSVLREAIAKWLVQYDHYLLGRTWKAFYVEEVRKKNRAGSNIQFRVELFAVDGIDFEHSRRTSGLSPANEPHDKHTPMSVDALLNWHISLEANRGQTDCKLFTRIHLGQSKTWATVVLRPHEFRRLRDEPGKPVMNDGCALMSRALAREICADLGLEDGTPSCFQGRIAGAKGLWMVDRPDPEDREERWIQVSDSQLKVIPHPCDFPDSVDPELVTFEVSNWSKPLRPVELNIQLLSILEHGGEIRQPIASIMRNAIWDIYDKFATVIEKDSIPLARALIQRLRPLPEEGFSRTGFRKIDQWAIDNTEAIIRFLEAGFSPRHFAPLRDRLRRCLAETLERDADELHIPIPLSTYAFCIADPYGVLAEDEVHLAFSSQWKDSEFEDDVLDDIDVLVSRLPAHHPSDVQKRRAVWKPELRHFKDVIVFPTRGDVPLAHLLSGGDYDGDKTWICWDQRIVHLFQNSTEKMADLSPEYFGLTRHARPMIQVRDVGDFLEGAFKFNLTVSNLGRCTIEHEKIIYEEPRSIGADVAKELAVLLSHLVDGRKAGLQLTEEAWQKYRKKISPRERGTPAYKDPDARKGKLSNIVDYLKFEIAQTEKGSVLKRFHELSQSLINGRDEDLLRPWRQVLIRADAERARNGKSSLASAIRDISSRIREAYDRWKRHRGHLKLTASAQYAAELVGEIQPPVFDHPLSHTWQNSEHEWQWYLASAVYEQYWRSSDYVWYGIGETLCQIKIGNEPSRTIRDTVYSSMKVNTRVARRLGDAEVDGGAGDSSDDDELESEDFDGASAIATYLDQQDSESFAGDSVMSPLYWDEEDGSISLEWEDN